MPILYYKLLGALAVFILSDLVTMPVCLPNLHIENE